jgi:tetratricopeptide (TPR) repeat protein
MGIPSWIAYSYWGLGNSFLLLRDDRRAEKALQAALELFTALGYRFQRIETMTSLGYIALEKKEYRSARELLHRSLEEAISIGFRSGFADCLNGLAAVAQQKDCRRAARLYSAGQAMAKTTGILSHEPPLMFIIQKYQAALLKQLDPGELDRSWQEGRLYSLDEALEYSLADDVDSTISSYEEEGPRKTIASC